MPTAAHSLVMTIGDDSAVTAAGGVTPSKWNDPHALQYGKHAISGADTISISDDSVTLAAGTYAVTVPAATGSGKPIYVALSGAGTVTLNRSGTDTIGGATSFVLADTGDWCVLIDQASGTWGLVSPRVTAGQVSATQLALLVQPRGVTSTAMAGATTTLTAASTRLQVFTGSGSTAQTVVLPDATTLPFVDWAYEIDNASSGTGNVTVNANGGGALWVIPPGGQCFINCMDKSTAAGTWDVDYFGALAATGKKLTVNNSLTLGGTDGTTMTFPSVSATIPPAASPSFSGTITRSGTGSPASITNPAYQAYDTQTATFENNIQNLSAGTSASSDYVATANTGSDTANYADFGINSSAYSDSAYTIGGALSTYLYGLGGDLTVGTGTAAKVIKLHTGGTLAANLRATVSDTALTLASGVALTGAGAITSSGGGVGYATGAGGTVTQGTGRTTGVTLSKLCGTISMYSVAQVSNAAVSFVLTNTLISANDQVIITHSSSSNQGAWAFSVLPAAGSCTIGVRNVSGGDITEATLLRFVVIKAVTA